jgi:hypothetical protein
MDWICLAWDRDKLGCVEIPINAECGLCCM